MKDNKYEKILQYGARLISQEGYKTVSLQRIANKVGLHKSTLFHYFKNKEELLLRILEKAVDEVNTDLERVINNNELEPEEKLRKAFYNQLTSMIGKHSDSVNAYLYELKSLSAKNQKIYLEKRKKYEKYFERIIAEMKAKGYFDGLDTKIISFGLLGMLNWVAKWYKNDGPLSIEQVSDIFYRVITKNDPPHVKYMFFELSEEQRFIQRSARKFAEEKIAPIQKEDEKNGVFRREIVSEMGKFGFFGGVIPKEYGGTNIGFLSSILIVEELAKVSASYSTHIVSQTIGPGLSILKHGTKSQIENYLPGLLNGDLIGCFASTEPDAGSDVASMKMKAIKNRKGFTLNGMKTWITNATIADVGLVFAYTDMENEHNGISCFVVELKNTPGITTRPIEKLGLSCCVVGEIIFEEVQLTSEALLGNMGEGSNILMEMLSNTRLFAAARALGVGGACLEASMKYAKDREQFGESISKFQMIQEQIAEMYIEHEASKLLVYQAALNKDNGRQDAVEVSVAKYFACEAAIKAADAALRIYGSYGFSMEYPIQRYIRDSRAFHITEGTADIQKVIIARCLEHI